MLPEVNGQMRRAAKYEWDPNQQGPCQLSRLRIPSYERPG
jgi:hypothetical protein